LGRYFRAFKAIPEKFAFLRWTIRLKNPSYRAALNGFRKFSGLLDPAGISRTSAAIEQRFPDARSGG
jgi:hypothetical protein